MSLYRHILKRAIKATWKFKYFLFFGLFATFFASTGVFNMILTLISGNVSESLLPFFGNLFQFINPGNFDNLALIALNQPINLIIILTLFLSFIFLLVILIWISVVSQAALVNSAAMEVSEKKHDFKSALNSGIDNFIPVFLLNIIIKTFFYTGLFILSSSFVAKFFSEATVFSGFSFTFLFVLFVCIIVIISFVVNYSIAYIVLKGKKLKEAILAGFNLFKNNWLISVEMALLLFVVDFFVSIIGLFVFTVVIKIPFDFMAIVSGSFGIFVTGSMLIALSVAFVGAVLTAFRISAWTDLFMVLTSQGATPKLLRITESFKKKKE